MDKPFDIKQPNSLVHLLRPPFFGSPGKNDHAFSFKNTVFIVVVSFLHCLSATCAARPTSLAETYVREEIEELREELGLGSYPAGAGLSIGDVEFRCVPSHFFQQAQK